MTMGEMTLSTRAMGDRETILSQVVGKLRRKRVPVQAEMVKAEMNGLLKIVGEVFEGARSQVGLQLEEVELSVDINTRGQVSLVGTGGELGSKGAILTNFCPSISFYPDQVLVDRDRLWLVDLDLCCQGDPALDIGNVIAHITEQSLRQMGNPSALGDQEAALQDAFIQARMTAPESRGSADREA